MSTEEPLPEIWDMKVAYRGEGLPVLISSVCVGIEQKEWHREMQSVRTVVVQLGDEEVDRYIEGDASIAYRVGRRFKDFVTARVELYYKALQTTPRQAL
jgi:hypothetical protein